MNLFRSTPPDVLLDISVLKSFIKSTKHIYGWTHYSAANFFYCDEWCTQWCFLWLFTEEISLRTPMTKSFSSSFVDKPSKRVHWSFEAKPASRHFFWYTVFLKLVCGWFSHTRSPHGMMAEIYLMFDAFGEAYLFLWKRFLFLKYS